MTERNIEKTKQASHEHEKFVADLARRISDIDETTTKIQVHSTVSAPQSSPSTISSVARLLGRWEWKRSAPSPTGRRPAATRALSACTAACRRPR